jgi:tetratricopeptide (TPR) repeat protein
VTAIGAAACYAANETPTPLVQARSILVSQEASKAEKIESVLRMLPIQQGEANWAEASFLYAELCLRLNQPKYTDWARQAFQILADRAVSPWKWRGQIGLLRLRAADAAEVKKAAEELDRLNATLAKEKDEAAIDGAYYLGEIHERLGNKELAAESYRFAGQLWKHLREYLKKDDFYSGILKEGQIWTAHGRVSPALAKTHDPQAALALFKKAKLEQSGRQYEQAAKLYRKTAQGFPDFELMDELDYRIAECEFFEGNFEQAERLLKKFIEARPQGMWRGQALVLLAEIALEQKLDPKKSKELVDKYFEGVRTGYREWDSALADAYFLEAAIAYIDNDRQKTIDALVRVKSTMHDDVPGTGLRDFDRLTRDLIAGKDMTPAEVRQGGTPQARTLLVLGDLYFRGERTAKAKLMFERLNPPPARVTTADLSEASAAKRMKGKPLARPFNILEHYRELTRPDGTGRFAGLVSATRAQRAYARWREGRCRYHQFDFAGALGCYGEFLSLYEGTAPASNAVLHAGSFADEMRGNGLQLAEACFEYVETRFPETNDGRNAAWFHAFIIYDIRPDESLRRAEQLLRKYPLPRVRQAVEELKEMIAEDQAEKANKAKGQGEAGRRP